MAFLLIFNKNYDIINYKMKIKEKKEREKNATDS
jgi:hypothetical protein